MNIYAKYSISINDFGYYSMNHLNFKLSFLAFFRVKVALEKHC